MEERADWLVMLLIGLLLLVWLAHGLRTWLFRPLPARVPDMPINENIPDHPAVDMLENAGYEVLGGKIKIPLLFDVDGEDFHSRLFIDFIARNDENVLYLVKVARNGFRWNGLAVRSGTGCFLIFSCIRAAAACYTSTWITTRWPASISTGMKRTLMDMMNKYKLLPGGMYERTTTY